MAGPANLLGGRCQVFAYSHFQKRFAMPKRFTETNKWKDSWFRRLSPESKLFWLYMVDNCDAAGMWEVDIELASFFTGSQYDRETLIADFSERMVETKYGWYITKFIDFQYGTLSENCKPHKPILMLLMKYEEELKRVFEGYENPIERVKEKDKDKEEEKEREGVDSLPLSKDDLFLKQLITEYRKKNGPGDPIKIRAFFVGEMKNGRTHTEILNAIYQMDHNTPYWHLFPKKNKEPEMQESILYGKYTRDRDE